MGTNTKIEWCDDSVNIWRGCAKVAPGCVNCYAEAMERRFGTEWGKGKPRVYCKGAFDKLRSLNAKAAREGRTRRVFINSLSDFFEDHTRRVVDNDGDDLCVCHGCGEIVYYTSSCLCGHRRLPRKLQLSDLRRMAFKLFDELQNLTIMLLTKRPENIRCMISQARLRPEQTTIGEVLEACLPLKNVWLYTSVSEQESADRNIPLLLECRDLVPVLGVSAEPLLGEIDFDVLRPEHWTLTIDDISNGIDSLRYADCHLDHVIVGGESGPQSRPCNVAWIRSLITQCKAAKVPCFVKQFGGKVVWEAGWGWDYDEPTGHLQKPDDWNPTLKHPKGGDMSEWPLDLRVREMPAPAE